MSVGRQSIETDGQSEWLGVLRCPDTDCAVTLCLYREGGSQVAWCRARRHLIGSCPNCGTALQSNGLPRRIDDHQDRGGACQEGEGRK